MKRIILGILFIGNAIVAVAQAPAPRLSTVVKNGVFTVNGKVISGEWSTQTTATVFGGNGRVSPGSNITHTYDNSGIVVFEKSVNDEAQGTIVTVEYIFASKIKNDVQPKSVHHGSFKLENLVINSNLTLAKLKNSLKMYEVHDAYVPHNYKLTYKGINLYFEFNAAETKLLDLSVGPDVSGK